MSRKVLLVIMERHAPDYMLLHSCSADMLRHTYGGDSKEYRGQIWHIDNALSRAIPTWREMGYDIIVTADHGMTAHHWHGGTEKMATDVPFYLFSDTSGPSEDEEVSQLNIAATVLTLLGLETTAGQSLMHFG